jgi:hypothetical protein
VISKERIENLLKENLTEKAFEFWIAISKKIPDIWDKPSSSSGKYHLRENGKPDSIADHTYEMLYACTKVMRFLKIKTKTADSDVLLLAIYFHDSKKYIDINAPHTDRRHDKMIGNTMLLNKNYFLKFLTENQATSLEKITRFHSGIWSTDFGPHDSLNKFTPEMLFVHILDMLSTNNCLKVPEEKEG